MAEGLSASFGFPGRRRFSESNYKGHRDCENQRGDRDDRLANRPGLDRLRHAHPEVLLHQPEPAVIHMRKDQRTSSGRNRQQLGMNARVQESQAVEAAG